MRKSRYIIAIGVAVSALVGASAQAQQPSKPRAAQQKLSGPERLSGAAADGTVLVATGKPAVDKAAVKAREERDAASNQAVSDGEAWFKTGNMQAAIASYKEALDITPDNGLAYRRMAEAYVAAGKLPQASQAFHKFLVEGFGSGNGNGGVVNTPDEWAEYALVLVKMGQPAEAVQAYNHAAYLLDYEVAGPEKGRSKVKVLLPELAAEPTASEQVQYTPERLQALADTALAHEEWGSGSEKQAYAHTLEAVALYPDSAVTHYYRGEIISGPIHSAEAKAEYQKAAELGDDATAAAAKERLAVLR